MSSTTRTTRPSLTLEREKSTPIAPPPARGRLLFVSDIAELLGGRKSPWWIRHRFAPAVKIKVGRDCAWYESDAYSWLDSQRGKSA